MTTFNFNVASTRAAAQNALGQDVMLAQADAAMFRKAAAEHQSMYRQLETEADRQNVVSASYTAQAKDLYRAFTKAFDEAKSDSINKSVIKLSYSLEDRERKEVVFAAIKADLWNQYVSSQEGMAQDLQDLRDFKGNQTLTPVELFNEYATNAKAESFRLLEKARTHREESHRLFVKADQTLIDAGLGSIVEENKARAHAKKELEKGVKNFKK